MFYKMEDKRKILYNQRSWSAIFYRMEEEL